MDSQLQLLFLKEKPVIKHSALFAKILTDKRNQQLNREQKEHKQKTHETDLQNYLKDLNNCYSQINNSIKKGIYDCICASATPKGIIDGDSDRYDFSLDSSSVKTLQDHGYTVENQYSLYDLKTRISWKN